MRHACSSRAAAHGGGERGDRRVGVGVGPSKVEAPSGRMAISPPSGLSFGFSLHVLYSVVDRHCLRPHNSPTNPPHPRRQRRRRRAAAAARAATWRRQ
jgi:hypothetical protein